MQKKHPTYSTFPLFLALWIEELEKPVTHKEYKEHGGDEINLRIIHFIKSELVSLITMDMCIGSYLSLSGKMFDIGKYFSMLYIYV